MSHSTVTQKQSFSTPHIDAPYLNSGCKALQCCCECRVQWKGESLLSDAQLILVFLRPNITNSACLFFLTLCSRFVFRRVKEMGGWEVCREREDRERERMESHTDKSRAWCWGGQQGVMGRWKSERSSTRQKVWDGSSRGIQTRGRKVTTGKRRQESPLPPASLLESSWAEPGYVMLPQWFPPNFLHHRAQSA